MTTPEHLARSKMLFKRSGLEVDMISSSHVLQEKNPELYEKYKYKINPIEIMFEKYFYIVELIPGVNKIAHKLIEKHRSKA